MKTQLDKDLAVCAKQWRKLLISLKQDIGDDYRCTDDPDDTKPGMLVTIGFTPSRPEINGVQHARDCSWHYQTGDNSYSGGAYSHRHWGLCYLHRRSNCKELAAQCADEIGESCFEFESTLAEEIRQNRFNAMSATPLNPHP